MTHDELISGYEELVVKYGETLVKVHVLEELAVENGWTTADDLKQRFELSHQHFYEEMQAEAQRRSDERNLRERAKQ
jgi:hypothetical protein